MLPDMTETDRTFVLECVGRHFGGEPIVSLGRAYAIEELEFAFSREDDAPAAFAAHRIEGNECEIVALVSAVEGRGHGWNVVREVLDKARSKGCRRVWLVATNDNLEAIGWYQKRGFAMVQVHRDSMDRERTMKPQIPLIGLHGIPLRDEIEFEYVL